MPSSTFNVRGQKVRTQTRRRYIVVAVRTSTFAYLRSERNREPFARIVKRTDSLQTARQDKRNFVRSGGAFAVVVDSTTGEEV